MATQAFVQFSGCGVSGNVRWPSHGHVCQPTIGWRSGGVKGEAAKLVAARTRIARKTNDLFMLQLYHEECQ
jgi:hypothetical protein